MKKGTKIALIVLGVLVLVLAGSILYESYGTACKRDPVCGPGHMRVDAEIARPASADEPITLDPSQVSISKADLARGETIIISGYSDTAYSVAAPRIKSCTGDFAGSDVMLVVAEQTMDARKVTNWKGILKFTSTDFAPGNRSVCTMAICADADCTTPVLSSNIIVSIRR